MALMLGRGISRENYPESEQNSVFDEPDSPVNMRHSDENDQSFVNEQHSNYNGYAGSPQSAQKSPQFDRSYSTPQRSIASMGQQTEDYDQVLWASAPHQVAVVNSGHVLSAQRYLSEIESVIEEKRNQLLQLRRSNEQRKLSMLNATGRYPSEQSMGGTRTNLGGHFSSTKTPTTPARNMLRDLDELTSSTKRTPGRERTPGAGIGEGAHGYLLHTLHESQQNEVESIKKITELKKMKDQREGELRQAQSEVQQLIAELRLRDEREQSLRDLLEEARRGGDVGPHFHEYHTTEIVNGGDNVSNEEIKKMLADISTQLQRTSQDRDKLMDDVMALQEELALERVRQPSKGGISTWTSVWLIVIVWCFIMLALYSHAVDFMPNTIDRYRITS